MGKILNEARIKQPNLSKFFMDTIQKNHLSHAYLFCGADGSGKLSVALLIAMRLFCNNVKNNFPCGKCNECRRIMNHNQPNVLVVEPKGTSIKIDQVRQLKSDLAKTATEGSYKVFIIDHADTMTESATNSLLKEIEEPQGNVVIILLAHNKNEILPTIVSRAQLINFLNISFKALSNRLRSLNIPINQIRLIASITSNIDMIKAICKNNYLGKLQNVIENWFGLINNHDWNAFPFIQSKLIPLVNSPLDKRLAIEIMIRIWQEVLEIKYKQISKNELRFPQISNITVNVAKSISVKRLLNNLYISLNDKRLLKANLNFQNIFENTTIKFLESDDEQ